MEASRKRNLLIIVLLGSLSAVGPFAIDMYLPAFPQIAYEMGTPVATIALSLSGYFVGLAAGQVIYGPLLDRFGRKRPVYFGLSLFILACIGCMLAKTPEMLVAFRVIQGFGGCVAQVAAITMVRDFFSSEESSRIISQMILVLGVSPLFAPTVGSFVAVHLGWQWVFVFLAGIVAMIMTCISLFLPEAYKPDPSISLKPVPILKGFWGILTTPQFLIYVLAGALSFAGLFSYVAGAPIIFMHVFKVSPQAFGGIFALLATGFIGGNQVNVFLSHKSVPSCRIFDLAIATQCCVGLIMVLGTAAGWFGLVATLITLFAFLSSTGLTYPNAAALALETIPQRNMGSASALLGFIQIGLGSLVSATIGLFHTESALPVIAIMASGSVLGVTALIIGRRFIPAPSATGVPREVYETMLREL